jgi:ribosomal protein S18 acetylase RimI-like enzyme
MVIVRAVIPVDRAVATVADRKQSGSQWQIAACNPGDDSVDVAGLVEACRQRDRQPVLREAGLRRELRSRSDRLVQPFGAWEIAEERPLVGLLLVVRTGTACLQRWSISWLVVHPAFRRRGLGRSLVSVACDHVRQQGGGHLHVETHAKWLEAVRFWRSVEASAS